MGYQAICRKSPNLDLLLYFLTIGRVLVLEGIEKVERNVLPVLNNLLENREMHLEDGRLLIPAARLVIVQKGEYIHIHFF